VGVELVLSKSVDGRALGSTVGSAGGKVNCPVAVRQDTLGTEVENCGVSLRGKGSVRGNVMLECLNILEVLVLFPCFRLRSYGASRSYRTGTTARSPWFILTGCVISGNLLKLSQKS